MARMQACISSLEVGNLNLEPPTKHSKQPLFMLFVMREYLVPRLHVHHASFGDFLGPDPWCDSWIVQSPVSLNISLKDTTCLRGSLWGVGCRL